MAPPWTLALKDVIDRAAALEMAYNLNDCVELRWGAPDKSDEASTCKRRALGGAAREDDGVPRLVPRAAPAAARLVRASNLISTNWMVLPGLTRQSILFVKSSCE